MVRPVPSSRADGRRAGQRLQRPDRGRQDECRREPGHADAVQHPRHSHAAALQGRAAGRAGGRFGRQGFAEEDDRPPRLTRRSRAHMSSPRNVIVIGSGPAGLTAALYTARANLKPLVIEGLEAGGQLMLTTLVENWPGHRDGIMGQDLMAEMRAQSERFGAEIKRGQVTSVDLLSSPFTVATSDAEYSCRAVRSEEH